MALSNKMGSAGALQQFGSPGLSIQGTTFLLDSNFVNATSGDALTMRFTVPTSQTNGAFTVYAFLTATTKDLADLIT
jgi:hypothetical protein